MTKYLFPIEQVKWQLPADRHASIYYRDDRQLKQSFRPMWRWLPAPVLWRIAVWMYYR